MWAGAYVFLIIIWNVLGNSLSESTGMTHFMHTSHIGLTFPPIISYSESTLFTPFDLTFPPIISYSESTLFTPFDRPAIVLFHSPQFPVLTLKTFIFVA